MNKVLKVVDIGIEVRNRRKYLRFSQCNLARMANCGVRFISELENGKETVRINKVLDVIHALDMSASICISSNYREKSDKLCYSNEI